MKKQGFTLVELMIMIVIIGILAALAIPRFLSATAKARLAEFKPVLKELYTLQETHNQETGKYSSMPLDIGFSQPAGKTSFSYTPYDGSGAQNALGKAVTLATIRLKLSNGMEVLSNIEIACIDDQGNQYASTTGMGASSTQLAKDAGLVSSSGIGRISDCN